MLSLVDRLLEADLVDEIRRVRIVGLNYSYKFKGRDVSYLEITCGKFKLRVKCKGALNSDQAYDFLAEKAREIRSCFCNNISFKAFYFEKMYKYFNP